MVAGVKRKLRVVVEERPVHCVEVIGERALEVCAGISPDKHPSLLV